MPRAGTSKEKPLPERIDLVTVKMMCSICCWTEVRSRSVTSRQVVERFRSARVRVLEVEVADRWESVSFFRIERMSVSDLRRFLNGAICWLLSSSSSEVGSALRRFFLLSAISFSQ